jgi:hypothetical protein
MMGKGKKVKKAPKKQNVNNVNKDKKRQIDAAIKI